MEMIAFACILINIIENLKTEGKSFGQMITPVVVRPTLHPWQNF